MTVSQDATSLRFIPQSLAEFTELLAGTGFANPFMCCMFNQTSGPCLDLIGSNNLTISGPFAGPGYLSTVSGWATKGIEFHNGTADDASIVGGALPDIATDSFLVFTWQEWPDPGAGVGRSANSMGSYGHSPSQSLAMDIVHDTVGIFTSIGGDSSPSPDHWADGNVHGMLLQMNRDVSHSGAGLTQVAMNDLGHLQITFPFNSAVQSQGAELHICGGESGGGGRVASGARCIYMCAWKGTDAELSLTELATLLDRFMNGVPIPPPHASPYWGPHFPDAAKTAFYWAPHFPDGRPAATSIVGVGPQGAATFALDLESGFKVTMSWVTDVIKTYSGSEYRAAIIDSPKLKFDGAAYLTGDSTRVQRGRLARFAAIGSPFSLALPFEEMTLVEDADAATLHVSDTSTCDWMIQGQYVSVIDADGAATDSIIQSFTSNTVTLADAAGIQGRKGSRLMPRLPIYLDPQQGFSRHPATDGTEEWQIVATSAQFGFQEDARKAFAALSGSTGALTAAVINYINTGTDGNAYTITFVGDQAASAPPNEVLNHTGTDYVYHFNPGVSTIANFLLMTAGIFQLSGSFDASDVLLAGDDEFGPVALTNGSVKNWGSMGVGATLASFWGLKVWDRPLIVRPTAGDSIHALSELFDLGGIPIVIGTANAADWGREFNVERMAKDEWQWIKAFLSNASGRQNSWWVSTRREDLIATAGTSAGVYTLKIAGPTPESGDFFAWFPSLRTALEIKQADGTVTYTKIDTATDNLDGTITIVAIDPDTTDLTELSGSPITRVSWLELCRFESDDFEVTFNDATFSMQMQARVVTQ